jgi:hypothetical protein
VIKAMSDRLLTSIIELEKALQEEVRREEERAAAWRERECAALVVALEAEQRQLQREEAGRAAAARQAAEAAAVDLRLANEAWCARLAALPDSFLKAALQRQLTTLLPGTGDDHPHGQG